MKNDRLQVDFSKFSTRVGQCPFKIIHIFFLKGLIPLMPGGNKEVTHT